MKLVERIENDLRLATKYQTKEVKLALRQIKSEYWRLTIPITLESGKKSTRPKKLDEIEDQDIISIINKLIKSEKEMIIHGVESTNINIYNRYLPKQVSQEEVKTWVDNNIDITKLPNINKAIGMIMKQFPGQISGETSLEIINQLKTKSKENN